MATPTLLHILFSDRLLMARILGTARDTLEGEYVYVTPDGRETTEKPGNPPTPQRDDDAPIQVLDSEDEDPGYELYTTSQCRVWVQLSQVCLRAALCLQHRMVRVRHRNDRSRVEYPESIMYNVDDLQEAMVKGNARVALHQQGALVPSREIRLVFANARRRGEALSALRRILVANSGVSFI